MRAGSAIVSGARHATGVALQALLIAAIVATIALAMSAVYKPAGFVAGLDSVDAARPASGHISIPDGEFGGTTTATANPGGDAWVHIRCYTDGSVGLEAWKRVNGDNQATFTLGPTPSWSGGSADCVGEEGYWAKGSRWRVVAETTFHVSD